MGWPDSHAGVQRGTAVFRRAGGMGSLPTVGLHGQLCGREVEGTGLQREGSGEEEEGADRVNGKQEESGRGVVSGDFLGPCFRTCLRPTQVHFHD